jgi:hypothetical protein
LSFFNINDAKQMLTMINNADDYQLKRISSALNICENTIQQEYDDKQIDQYTL